MIPRPSSCDDVRSSCFSRPPFVQSLENLDDIPGRKVSHVQSIHIPDSRKNIHKLHVIDADEVMEARQIGNQILPCFETEDIEHEILGDIVEPLDTCRRREFDT